MLFACPLYTVLHCTILFSHAVCMSAGWSVPTLPCYIALLHYLATLPCCLHVHSLVSTSTRKPPPPISSDNVFTQSWRVHLVDRLNYWGLMIRSQFWAHFDGSIQATRKRAPVSDSDCITQTKRPIDRQVKTLTLHLAAATIFIAHTG